MFNNVIVTAYLYDVDIGCYLVSMQAQKDFPVPLPKDKFLVQSMIAPVGLNAEDITSEMV